jgi:hypothetical protein
MAATTGLAVAECAGYPTILLAQATASGYGELVRSLQKERYLVLVATSIEEAVRIAATHSRPIHLLVAQEGAASAGLAASVRLYQSSIQVLLVRNLTQTAVPAIQRILPPPAAGGRTYAATI